MKPIHDITSEKFEKYYHSYVKNVMKEIDRRCKREFLEKINKKNPRN